MKRFLLVAAICLIAAPCLVNADLQKVDVIKSAAYDLQTGQITSSGSTTRIGTSIWAAIGFAGWFWGEAETELALDWGDVGTGSTMIGGFGAGYATNCPLGYAFDLYQGFFAPEGGFGDADYPLIIFQITGLPGCGDPTAFWGWIVTFDLDAAGFAFDIGMGDVDGDTLNDFGYSYWFDNQATYTFGPILASEPNLTLAPGEEDAFDLYNEDAANAGVFTYVGTYWFGGPPIFSQFYMELYNSSGGTSTGCPTPGAHGKFCTADIQGADCIVDLADLAALLGSYNKCTGDPAYLPAADLVPNGCVDLADLAELLGQYGDNCN